MRIVYFGSPELSVPFLSALLNEPDFDVVATVTQPEKPVGRKAILTKCAVHAFAEQNGIPVLPLASLKTKEAKTVLAALNADVFVVVVYGKIIPKAILDLPRFGCVNVHPSLLPKFRGPTPYQYAILQGETKTGVSIMLLDEGMDTGPVLAVKPFIIELRETSESIQSKIIQIGVPLLLETLKKWTNKEIEPSPQNNDAATYSKILKKEDAKMDWSKSAVELDRHIRAFKPWPGTYFYWKELGKDVRISVLEANVTENKTQTPGSVRVDQNRVFVTCGDGTELELVKIQPEGKSAMNPIDYIRGHQTFLEANLILS